MKTPEEYTKENFPGIEKETWYPVIVAVADAYAKYIALLNLQLEANRLANFADWLHNNWYEPDGYEGCWRLRVEDTDYELPKPKENIFFASELATAYLNKEGIF